MTWAWRTAGEVPVRHCGFEPQHQLACLHVMPHGAVAEEIIQNADELTSCGSGAERQLRPAATPPAAVMRS